MYGKTLRKAREERGLNLDQAAEQTGITKTSLWRMETEESKVSVERFFAISDVYGFDPIELLKGKTSTGMTEADYDRLKQVVMMVMELLYGLEKTPSSKQIAAAAAEVMKLETLRCAEQPDTEFESERYEGLAKLVFGDG